MLNYVLCDLDGTILHDWARHYDCYCDIVEKYGGRKVSMERYIELKRSRTKRTVLLEETEFKADYDVFVEEWLERIEQPYYLAKEQLKPQAVDILKAWKKSGTEIVLLTMRRNRDGLFEQLRNLEIDCLFSEIYNGNPMNGMTKVELLERRYEGNGLVVGDSEADELLARKTGTKFAMFTDGVRDPKDIEADYYVSSWAELREKI